MLAIMSATSFTCFVLKGPTILYLECTCTYSRLMYHWACTTSRTDTSHLELSHRNKVCQHILDMVSGLVKTSVSSAIAEQFLASPC